MPSPRAQMRFAAALMLLSCAAREPPRSPPRFQSLPQRKLSPSHLSRPSYRRSIGGPASRRSATWSGTRLPSGGSLGASCQSGAATGCPLPAGLWAALAPPPSGRRWSRATVFDLASLTKSIATATSILRSWPSGARSRSTRRRPPTSPEFARNGKGGSRFAISSRTRAGCRWKHHYRRSTRARGGDGGHRLYPPQVSTRRAVHLQRHRLPRAGGGGAQGDRRRAGRFRAREHLRAARDARDDVSSRGGPPRARRSDRAA